VDENVDPAKLERLCSAFPHLGFGVPVGVGWAAPALGVGPAGRWVRALDELSVWPPEPGIWSKKISWDSHRGLAAQGVTSDLATCRPVQDVLAQGILD